ncbi:alpha-soluble NSF attachment protein SEC17 Ecym_7184 [Eremothecium cymbalariae DBVPG|uniref:Vesicular-fusion protein SEC17 n=1 Tax=Eremothecium cymbalariae (strain CBS 270.75 / DBVPG 7215 / KCTC 17166 / NRRL Y-17582) TaxID=931890 RepID=G8JW17_ERECY|nr:hypothetical protein Ecym_7184 [Eremothecium cymbalariae DBVPG\
MISEAQDLIARAEKKAQPSSGFTRWLSGGDSYRLEEASDLYIEAANLYRLSKQLDTAGDTFWKAAQCQVDASNEDEAGNTFVEAYKCYKSSNPQKACEALEKAIGIFTRRGQFRRGAYFKFELADIQEFVLQDYPKAIENFEIAGDWYLQDQALALSNKSYIRCADLKALDKNYLDAAEIYRKIIANSLGNKLSQWSLKDHYLKLILCYLAAGDTVAAEKVLQEALQEDTTFQQSREHTLLSSLIDAVKEGNIESFSSQVFDYDKFNKLDKWKTTVLLQIKDSISEAEDDLL